MTKVSDKEEKFNINEMLERVFQALQMKSDCSHREIVYVMDRTVPRMFCGNVTTIEEYLVKVFHFISKTNKQNEILVEIHGPKEFVYTDDIIFTIKNIKLTEDDINNFLKNVEHESGVLNAKLNAYSSSTLTVRLPFTVSELGIRRHYRLPSKSLLQKNVLIIAESQNITLSITKMFKYFPYNVDMGMQKYQEGEYDLSQYHLVVIENKLMTENLNLACKKVQKTDNMKLVVLGSLQGLALKDMSNITSSLSKPVTQESIFELIISIFSDEYNSGDFLKNRSNEKQIENVKIDVQDTLENIPNSIIHQTAGEGSFEEQMEKKKNKYVAILDTHLGKKNTKTLKLNYEDELENFFDIFDGSDLYFREIVNERSFQKIKVFCLDLEKHSKIIGAQSMLRFTDIINLMFAHEKTDTLPIYPGRYHIELKKLFKEMEHYFSY